MLFMVPLDLPSARPMAQALRLPFEYYYYFYHYSSFLYFNYLFSSILCPYRNLKLASPRLNVVILVALSLTLTDPLFTWLVLSANDYNIELPLGGNILCWVCAWVCFLEAFFSIKIVRRALGFTFVVCVHMYVVTIHQIFL